VATRRRYREDSLILETEFDTATGTVRITDCMPMRDTHPHVVRLVEGISGSVDMHMDLAVRFDYGEIVPWLTSTDGLIRMTAGPDAVALWHRVDPVGHDMHTVADFTVSEGQRFPFTFVWFPSHEEPPPPLDAYYAINLTDAYWKEWPPYAPMKARTATPSVRSLITLKALTYEPPAASWRRRQHRFPRPSAVAVTGTTAIAGCVTPRSHWSHSCAAATSMRPMAWRDWLLRAVAGDVSRLQNHVRPVRRAPAG